MLIHPNVYRATRIKKNLQTCDALSEQCEAIHKKCLTLRERSMFLLELSTFFRARRTSPENEYPMP